MNRRDFANRSNVRGIIQGHLDTPLNAHGRVEAGRLADALSGVDFSEAYTSPLSRAHEVGSDACATDVDRFDRRVEASGGGAADRSTAQRTPIRQYGGTEKKAR